MTLWESKENYKFVFDLGKNWNTKQNHYLCLAGVGKQNITIFLSIVRIVKQNKNKIINRFWITSQESENKTRSNYKLVDIRRVARIGRKVERTRTTLVKGQLNDELKNSDFVGLVPKHENGMRSRFVVHKLD